jgi:hypothetical protein
LRDASIRHRDIRDKASQEARVVLGIPSSISGSTLGWRALSSSTASIIVVIVVVVVVPYSHVRTTSSTKHRLDNLNQWVAGVMHAFTFTSLAEIIIRANRALPSDSNNWRNRAAITHNSIMGSSLFLCGRDFRFFLGFFLARCPRSRRRGHRKSDRIECSSVSQKSR